MGLNRGLKNFDRGVKNTDTSESTLSAQQIEIYNMLTEQYLTPKMIARIRKTSLVAVYKTMNKLIKMGFLIKRSKGLNKSPTTKPLNPPKDTKNMIRLHAQEWNIRLIWKDERYENIMTCGNTFYFEQNTIRLFSNSIEVYSGRDFWAETTDRATHLSMDYWNRFFVRLENHLNVIFLKPRKNNIKLVNQHYAHTDSEIAKDLNDRKEKLRVYAREDGKLAIIVDNSFNMDEFEALHPKTAKPDSNTIEHFVKDLRENPTTLSEIIRLVGHNTQHIGYFGEQMVAHVDIQKTTTQTLKELSQTMTEIKDFIRDNYK